ncbi:MAG: hypothetical protein COA85_05920 [Robiginitomaculum sp.]|nr:MAG: hypothetical protein COA85_05920 [Robiginitomaculum sp.]
MCAVKRLDRFDQTELNLIKEALDAGDLWPYVPPTNPRRHFIGDATKRLQQYFKRPQPSDLPYVIPTSSGTASIHVALAGLQIPAGSEVIVSPITDIGTVTPIIMQNAIPVFADIDPDSGNMTAETIRAQINERTSAVIVVHLTGSPVDMEPIMRLCKAKGIKVIEDAAQALGAKVGRQRVGTFGDAGCFSLNSQKHITAGEGGFVIVHDEDQFYRCHNFSDKHRDRFKYDRNQIEGDEHSKYEGMGLNYRMSELNGAMILGQLGKLEEIARRRNDFGATMDRLLGGVSGIVPQKHIAKSRPTFFFHMFRVEKPILDNTKRSIRRELNLGIGNELSIRIGGGYGEPLYKYPMFKNKNFFDQNSNKSKQIWPAELVASEVYNTPPNYMDYKNISRPHADAYILRSFSLWCNEKHTEEHAELLATEIVRVLKSHSAI